MFSAVATVSISQDVLMTGATRMTQQARHTPLPSFGNGDEQRRANLRRMRLVATSLLSGAARSRGWWGAIMLISLAQGVVGYTQYLTGLPEILVLVHMLGAAALTVTVTGGLMSLWSREPVPADPEPAARSLSV